MSSKRFALARRDASFDSAMTAQVAPPKVGVNQLVAALFLLSGIAFLVALLVGAPKVKGDPWGLVVWCAISVGFVWHAWRPMFMTTQARLACAVQRETARRNEHDVEVVVVAFEDGTRVELTGPVALLAPIAVGDMGVVHLRAKRLLGFRRMAG